MLDLWPLVRDLSGVKVSDVNGVMVQLRGLNSSRHCAFVHHIIPYQVYHKQTSENPLNMVWVAASLP